MSESSNTPPAAPVVRRAQRWNIVWVVPLVALLLGAWLLYRNFAAQGPVARIRFETAELIFAGSTEVRCRSVRVGVVKKVALADDLKSVVVKPRLSAAEISGLGTLIQGSYIELDPGPAGGEPRRLFKGRENPPATNRNVPGLRLELAAETAGSVTIGAPIYHRGFEVGRVEDRQLAGDGSRVTYNVFISDEHRGLVTDNTRFWNTSGIDISAGADGFKVRTPSLQAMVSGGISFGVTTGEPPGKSAQDGTSFTLYRDEETARKSTFNPTARFILMFDQSVRGLAERAPVEFRGITLGRVADISFDLAPGNDDDRRVPVLIEIDPLLMRSESRRETGGSGEEVVREAVANGMRAGLRTGSLITGALFVDLDYYPEAPAADLKKTGEFWQIPTVSSGLAQLEAKVTAILDKIQAMPLEKTMADVAAAAEEAKTTVAEARKTLQEIEATAAAARATLEDPEFRELPADLRQSIAELSKSVSSLGPDGAMQGDLLRTLDELRASLRSIKAVTTTIDEKPNSLLFGRDSSGNPKPKAPR